jgi:methyl-accepting chemotaxis protein
MVVGTKAAVKRAADQTNQVMKNIQTTVIPGINEIISDFKEAPGHLTKTAEEVGSVVKIGIGMGVLKFFSDIGISWYQAIKLTGIASDAKNAFKKLADNTSKTEDEVVNVLKNTSDNLGSSVSQFTKDTHKMGQNFGHMTETISQSSVEISSATNKASQDFGHIAKSLSQSSAEISGAVNQTSRNFGYMTHVLILTHKSNMKQIEKQEKIVVLSITSLLNLILTHKSKM